MASADTLCKKLLSVKSVVVTGHDFYQDSDGLRHCNKIISENHLLGIIL